MVSRPGWQNGRSLLFARGEDQGLPKGAQFGERRQAAIGVNSSDTANPFWSAAWAGSRIVSPYSSAIGASPDGLCWVESQSEH